MGRRLSGPVRIPGGGDTFYARLTVRHSLREQAKAAGHPLRVVRSLGTSAHTEALQRWPGVYRQLQEELEEALRHPRPSCGARRRRSHPPLPEEMRRRVAEYHRQVAQAAQLSGEDKEMAAAALDPFEVAEAISGEEPQMDPSLPPSRLFDQVYFAMTQGKVIAASWQELINLHAETKQRRRGEPLSKAWRESVAVAVRRAVEAGLEHPELLTKADVRRLLTALPGSSTTKAKHLSLLQAVIQTGIEEDVLPQESNPFRLVRFSAATRPEDQYQAFTRSELKRLLTGERADFFTILVCTGLRISELLSRDPLLHHEGGMLTINKYRGFTPKTRSSYRRVPLPKALVPVVQELLPIKGSQASMTQRLQQDVRRLFPGEPRLVVHSCRHTFKTLARQVSMPADISDEITGHRKASVSAVSDGYGHYPDELLRTWGEELYSHLVSMVKG
jgi:integrase